ncbi:MAG: hypothetical protein JJE03_03300 [Peptostreptococcaceae bacterium]|nr:hypothetical protein [Peptostreptococcaceae bacterium]
MWKEGNLKVYDSIFHYWIKAYEVGSSYGIDGSRVNKLALILNSFSLVLDSHGLAIDRINQLIKFIYDILIGFI